MIHEKVLLVLSLLFAVNYLHALSLRLHISFPILLVLAGLLGSFLPHADIVLDPELVFLIFLPPLLYEAAWFTSWKDFWRLRGAIFLQGFGLVFVTSGLVAWLSMRLIPGFTWPLGFLLGSIVSPPDAVAATLSCTD